MKQAKLFQNGQSQAVRLPKEFRFEGKRVYIHRIGQAIVLLPEQMDDPWQELFYGIEEFSQDFMLEREQPELQERDGWVK